MGIKNIENEFHHSAITREARAIEVSAFRKVLNAITSIFRESAFAEHAEQREFEREVAKFRSNTNTLFPRI